VISCWIPSSKWCHSLKVSTVAKSYFIMKLIINLRGRKFTRIEIDRMKKIVFSKLWKCGAYGKVKSIHLQDKRFGKVYMNQKWGSCERNLQRLKSIINFNSSKKGLIVPSQLSKRGHYWKIVGNETSIKVNKFKKTSDISNKNKVAQSTMVWTLRRSMWMPSLKMT
jgi:hypothetical protein